MQIVMEKEKWIKWTIIILNAVHIMSLFTMLIFTVRGVGQFKFEENWMTESEFSHTFIKLFFVIMTLNVSASVIEMIAHITDKKLNGVNAAADLFLITNLVYMRSVTSNFLSEEYDYYGGNFVLLLAVISILVPFATMGLWSWYYSLLQETKERQYQDTVGVLKNKKAIVFIAIIWMIQLIVQIPADATGSLRGIETSGDFLFMVMNAVAMGLICVSAYCGKKKMVVYYVMMIVGGYLASNYIPEICRIIMKEQSMIEYSGWDNVYVVLVIMCHIICWRIIWFVAKQRIKKVKLLCVVGCVVFGILLQDMILPMVNVICEEVSWRGIIVDNMPDYLLVVAIKSMIVVVIAYFAYESPRAFECLTDIFLNETRVEKEIVVEQVAFITDTLDCPVCGTENSRNNMFCTNCGERLQREK